MISGFLFMVVLIEMLHYASKMMQNLKACIEDPTRMFVI